MIIIPPQGCPDQSVVTTALMGVVVFIVGGMLIAALVRERGLFFLQTKDDYDPGFVVQTEEFNRVFE